MGNTSPLSIAKFTRPQFKYYTVPAKITKHGMNLSFATTIDLGCSVATLSEDNSGNSKWSATNESIAENMTKEFREKRTASIDSLLLDQTPPHHSVDDSVLSEMDIPSPTDMDKLKYHLTEPRLPPARRKTFNYSFEIPEV